MKSGQQMIVARQITPAQSIAPPRRTISVKEWALGVLTEEEYEDAMRKAATPPAVTKPKRKPRTKPEDPSYEQIRNAVTLPLRLAPLRFPGTTESAFRHMFYKHMPEFLNPKNGKCPEGFAACIVKISQRKYALNCPAFEAFQRVGHLQLQGH